MKTRLVIGLSIAVIAVGLPAQAVVVTPGSGVTFHQIDFTFTSASQTDSSYGMVIVDFSAVASATGISDGYLNVVTSNGWVVRNMPVWTGAGLPGVGTMFDLGSTGDVTNITALVDVSPVPPTTFSGTPSTSFGVAALPYNAEGGESARTAVPAPMSLAGVVFDPIGEIERWWQYENPSIEQDLNQCLPAAVANSFQWLENKYGIDYFPHDHVPGIRDGSLVGELDKDMERAAHGLTYFVKQLSRRECHLERECDGRQYDVDGQHRCQPIAVRLDLQGNSARRRRRAYGFLGPPT
jgi:hypothetical protein